MNSGSKRSWSAVAAADEVVDFNAVQQDAELYSSSASEGDHRIKDLEAAMQHGAAGTLALDDVRENTKLREEVMAHRQFLHAFLKMVKGSPTEEQSRRQIYDEGAESAKTMILGILADSQHKEWESVKLPSELRRLGHSFEMHYKLADRLFTSGSHSAEESTQRSQKRLQLRVDYSLEGISTQEVADRVTAVLCAPKGKDRFVRLASNSRERVELRPLPNGDTGENTMFLHHRKRYPPPQKDRDAVFLFHRCKTKMARSTLAPPPKLVRKPAQDTPGGYVYERPQLCQPRKRGRPLGSKANKNKPWAFGQADVNILARMSTSLVVGASQSEDAQRITSPILHGAFVFTEETLAEEDGEAVSAPRVRLVFIMSTPPEFSEEEEFGSIEAILRPDGSLTKNFAKYIHVFGQNIGASLLPHGASGEHVPRPNLSASEVRRLRQENAALRARVEELEAKAHEEEAHPYLPLDAWHALGEAISQGSQRVVNQILGNTRLLAMVTGHAAADAEAEAEDEDEDEEMEDPEMQNISLLSSRSLLAQQASFCVKVHGVSHLPVNGRLQHKELKNGYVVTATIDRTGASAETAVVWTADGFVTYSGALDDDNEENNHAHGEEQEEMQRSMGSTVLDLGRVMPADVVIFRVDCQYFGRLRAGLRMCVGEVRVCVSDLVHQACVPSQAARREGLASATMWLKDPETDIVVFDDAGMEPCRLQVSVDYEALAEEEGFPLPRGLTMSPPGTPSIGMRPVRHGDDTEEEEEGQPRGGSEDEDEDDHARHDGATRASSENTASTRGPRQYAKHVFVCTRGTRGDVQPFIALARGLASQCGYLVTICTEDRYRPLVERYSEVPHGAIQFRTSGGDSEKRITTAVAQWALRQSSTAMQLAMLGHSEREFFDSEPMFHYWCRALRPDVVMFGFTTAHIAMILSESLRIPIIGFMLQPSVIPSKHYPAISPIANSGDPVVSHTLYGRIKLFMENNPFDFNAVLNSMRRARGLQPYSYRVNDYGLIVSQDIPVIVPINQTVFGGKPSDWHEHAVLTDFIFLRSGAVPPLDARYMRMIVDARAAKEPLVVMAFSSMPVPRTRILELAIMVVEQCAQRPRVIALVGNSNAIKVEELSGSVDAVESRAHELVSEGRMLVDAGAPFSKLFPQVDCVIAHGGLGTTGEILRAGKPSLTTGVLIMDQRFWGRRVFELGCGPAPVHVQDLHKVLVTDVDACLDPESSYAARARELAASLEPDSDGVDENVSAFTSLLPLAHTVRPHRESIMRSPRRFMAAMASDAGSAAQRDVAYVRGLITSTVVENAREMRYRALGEAREMDQADDQQ
ncbi:Sterol 3-beta-glucosyltransferase [Hondaea fermentalgiana]|uniref:Sterol 3-beta-glucosyltransferase n=1 Tax=Hondaea fermentalgiana TaxID=2315210 RepID=A0A2R5G753_9STRA|nr:Sterol 3-beta-glucosyltransferase [Hondaea fermentalgiana]|eukprot:GBG24283.1 Sterol 3-beta-glucosyltransferase [Hondaea fermentalgiana]